jgi:rhodanese-related sulfurtransferase
LKSLFNPLYLSYTEDGNKLADEAFKAVEAIFTKYASQGFNLRDIGHIIHQTVPVVEAEKVLLHAVKEMKEKKVCAPCRNGFCSKH